jgi:protein-disulfide isomerase
MQSATLELARGEQKQTLEVLITTDGRYAIFNAAQGTLAESKIKGAKEATVSLGRPIQVILAADGNSVVVGAVEDISIDVAAEKAKKLADELKKAEENVKKVSLVDQPTKGPKTAKVTIVEFSDFQCPFCARAHQTLTQVAKEYGNKVQVVYKNFPLGFHPWAEPAAIAGECAYQQDPKGFWTLYDYFFDHQKELAVDNVKAKSLEALKGSKVNEAKFNECFDGKKTLDLVKKDLDEGQAVGVTGTPAFLINGRFLSGAQPAEKFKEIIDDELNRAGKKS